MKYLIVAFRSRTESLKMKEILSRKGYGAEIINTPKEAKVGCGLSVKTYAENFAAVKYFASYYGFKTTAGYFYYEGGAGGKLKAVYP